MHLLITGAFGILLSCSNGKKRDINSFQTFTVKRGTFVNSITVSGTLETSRSISFGCPIGGYDLQITYLVPEGSLVRRGDTLCKLECTLLETQYNDAVSNVDLAESNFEKAQAQQLLESSLLESQIKTNEASTKIAMLDSSKLAFLSPANRRIAELRIEQALIEKQKLARKLDFMKKINKSALQALQVKIRREENNMKIIGDKLNKLMMVSDTSGIVQYDRRWGGPKVKEGDVIWQGMNVLKLVDLSDFQVRLLVNESQFQCIQKDQAVEMTIDSYKHSRFKGKIVQKKPAGRPIRDKSNVKVFEVVASVDTIDLSFQPGVSVTCKVFLTSLKDTISVPIMSVFEQDSLKVVYVRNNNKFRKQVITISELSDKFIIVTKGLKLNEQILLTEPPAYLLQ